jgi:propionate CoA-transferase
MKIITEAQAAAMVQSGWTVASAGFVGAGHAEAITSALERRFLETGLPRDLTLVYSAGQGDRATRGVNHFGNPGMTRCVVGGHWRSATRLGQLALDEQCEGYNLPQGVMTHLYRAIAGGKPGVLTKIGLNTFVDPRTELDARFHGGAINARAIAATRAAAAADAPRWVEAVRFRGEDYLFYPSFPINCALIRATASDANGNLSTHEEAFHHELLSIAQAARNSGGIVIAQVRRMVDHHDNLQAIHVPGILVDAVVVCADPHEHQMTFGESFNPAYFTASRGRPAGAGEPATAAAAMSSALHAASALPSPPIALDARTIVQRRALMEVVARGPRVVNLGVGMPAGVAALAAAENIGGFTLTVEAGPIGGTPADGLSFGASSYPEAVVDQPAQFDFYDGGGIDLAFLGLAELDAHGNVNVSKFGEDGRVLIAGVGGFINITQSAKALVFMGTLTAGGLQIEAREGELKIVSEGRLKKIVANVAHLSFNGPYVASLGIPVLYVTERAVFAMRAGCLTLIEIAPGIDLQGDVLDQCATPVVVAADLRQMDARLFTPGPMTWLTDRRVD